LPGIHKQKRTNQPFKKPNGTEKAKYKINTEGVLQSSSGLEI